MCIQNTLSTGFVMETHANTEKVVKVVRVTSTEFELSDGQVFQHVVPLDDVPTPEEFQVHYDRWKEFLESDENGKTAIGG